MKFKQEIQSIKNDADALKAIPELINNLQKLSHTELMSVFQSHYFPLARYTGFVDLISRISSDTNALLLLNLIEKLSSDNLQRLFYGRIVYTGEREEFDNLMRKIGRFSPPVVAKALKILGKLPAGDIKDILCSGEGDCFNPSTPLEMVFAPKNRFNPEAQIQLAKAFIDALSHSDLLCPILIKAPRANSEPFLHQLVRHKILPVISHYLERPKLNIHHTDACGQTALDIASNLHYDEAIALFKAQPLHAFLLKTTTKNRQEITALFEETLKQYPRVLATRWQGQKTLAHIAIERKNASVLRLLLSHGADANAKDEQQLSLLDYAISCNQSTTLQILTSCARTTLTEIKSDGHLALPQLLALGDFPVVQSIITNLHTNAKLQEERSFVAALILLPKARLTCDALQQELKKMSTGTSRLPGLIDYCRRTNDTLTFFLLQVGDMLTTKTYPALIQTAQNFVKEHLSLLANSDSELEKEAARLQLIVLLFAMKAEALAVFLKSLTLAPEHRIQLDVTLCHALVQPLIYSSLTLSEHQLLLEQLYEQQIACHSIAQTHFRCSDLTQLPAALLQQLSKGISKETLYQHSQNRLNPAIIVLALNEGLSSEYPESDILSRLFSSLEKELQRCNQDKSSQVLEELRMMLNLATHPRIQDAIERFLREQPHNSEIWGKIDTLLSSYRKDQPLVAEGLLRKLFIKLANKADYIAHKDNQAALINLLTIASHEEIQRIIASQQQATQPHLLASSLLSCAVSSDKAGLNNYQLSQELYHLNNKTAHLALTPLVNAACGLGKEARSLSQIFTGNEHETLNHALHNLALMFDNLTAALITSQFEPGIATRTASLTALEAMQNACRHASSALDKHLPNSRTNSLRCHSKTLEQQRLMNLLHAQAAFAFPEALSDAFKTLDKNQIEKEQAMQPAWRAQPHLQPLQAVFASQKSAIDDSSLNKSHHWQTTYLNQRIKRFNDSLKTGISLNPAVEELLPALTSWQTGNGVQVTKTSLIKQIPKLISNTSEGTLASISQQQDHTLLLLQKSAPLLAGLQRLANSQSCLNDVLDALYATDMDTLTQFTALTAKAQVHDLNRLSQYILAGKTHHWDIERLKTGTLPGESSIQWLPNSLSSLDNFSSSILSVKALLTGIYLNDERSDARLNAFSTLLKTHTQPLTCDAIVMFATSHAALLNKDLLSKSSQIFVLAFSELIQQSPAFLQTEVITNLPSEFFNQLLEHVLSGVASPDQQRAAGNKVLLTNLCQQATQDGESKIITIKKRLGSQDMTLLGDACLISLAKEVLTEKSGLDDLTYDGVWIQRLLVSPRFVSACPPETLQNLVERYRALSLTLKQDEFERLNDFIAGKLGFADQHRDALQRWQQELLSNPEARQRLMAKRDRLLLFRADDSIRALYNQLEDNCFELRQTHPALANQALNHLYTHHNQQLASMRSDILFRVADFVYSQTIQAKGDLPKHQNPLLTWLEQHLPHHNFQQAELKRKSCVRLFNETGEAIGYLDESNHARALVNDQPVSLLEVTGLHTGSELYDENRQRLGMLTATSQLKQENVFQQHTSALLVGKMPIDQLEKSPAALDLLIQDICNENSLTTLYAAAESQEKRAWLQQQVAKHLQEYKQDTTPEIIHNFVTHHPIESILDALGNSSKPENAERLFSAILANESKRRALFAKKKSPLLTRFFNHINSEETLTTFLLTQHKQAWFHEGLALFIRHMPKQGLLANSLQKLKSRVLEQTLSASTCDAVIQTLINSEKIARTVLQEGSTLTHFFAKHHLIPVIKTLNEKTSWENCAQYQLMLTILKAEHEQLFPGIEPHQSDKFAWNADDLQHMTAFATRHTNNNFDRDGTIRQRLLSELVFRCANFGQIALFYKKTGQLNAEVAGSHLQRSTIDALAAQYYLVNYAKEAVEQMIAAVQSWLGGTDEKHDKNLDEELKDNHAIIDWKALAKASWSHTKSTELPLIAAFLLNYSGTSAALSILLDDLLKNTELMQNRNIVHHIAQIMGYYPHRDVSHVIFKALLEASTQNPQLIDKTVLTNLITFHTHAHMSDKGALEPLEAERSLLTHFGQQKNYALSIHVAQLLYKPQTLWTFFLKCFGYQSSDNVETNTLFGRALTEARIEGDLLINIGRWFFGLQKKFKRWWHYGSSGTEAPTGIIKFCDDDSPYSQTWAVPDTIRTPISDRHTSRAGLTYMDNYKETQGHYLAVMERMPPPKEIPKESPILPDADALNKFGIFSEIKKVLETPMPVEIPAAMFG